MDKIEELLTRGVANIIPSKQELKEKLKSGEKLNIYLGIDPTSTRLHLGHTVPLRKIQAFADAGHNVTFLIGDFTALIGDTSDKESERPILTVEEIEENFRTYKKQAEKVIDFNKVKVRNNSEWLKKLTFEEIVKLTQHFSLGDFISRELIKKRLTENKKIGLHEVLYPVMQGYDSYFMNTDIQVGGTDQTFNMQTGRTLQKDLRNKQSFVLSTPILEGTDGRKMSKSLGNAVWLEDSPEDIFAGIMAINDNLIIQYFTLVTNIPMEEIQQIENVVSKDPMKAKKKLAFEITKELQGEKNAMNAQEHFEKTVQNKELPADIQTYLADQNLSIIDLLINSKLAESKSDAKRLIEQGGVSMDNKIIKDANEVIDLTGEHLLKVGKRKFLKVKSA
ncbi:tyrosine--tRNA ligase [Patescibacteria group bacterium]|nr:tyrosine--tRNA ligase [Patescibacteria group bacterium]